MPRRALLVIDFGEGSGLGHLRRAAALSTALAARGWEARCGRATDGSGVIPLTGTTIDHLDALDVSRLVETRPEYEACVIDSYRIDRDLRDQLAPYTAIDDLGDPGDGALIVVNAAGGDYAPGPELLLGSRYALLGSDVIAAASAASPPIFPPRQVLVALGAGASHAVLAEVLATIAEGIPGTRFSTVGLPGQTTSPGRATGIASQIATVDFVVTAGGVTSLETAALGRPALGLILAENQACNIEMLEEAGALIASEPTQEGLAAAIASIDDEAFGSMARSGPRAVDGHGAERVADAIDKTFGHRTR